MSTCRPKGFMGDVVTSVTVIIRFWKRDGYKGSNKFVWDEVQERVLAGVGFEGRIRALVKEKESHGWKVFWDSYKILCYHYD